MNRRILFIISKFMLLAIGLLMLQAQGTAFASTCSYEQGYYHYFVTGGGLVLLEQKRPGGSSAPFLAAFVCRQGALRPADFSHTTAAAAAQAGFPDGIPREIVAREDCWAPSYVLKNGDSLHVWDELTSSSETYHCSYGNLDRKP